MKILSELPKLLISSETIKNDSNLKTQLSLTVQNHCSGYSIKSNSLRAYPYILSQEIIKIRIIVYSTTMRYKEKLYMVF